MTFLRLLQTLPVLGCMLGHASASLNGTIPTQYGMVLFRAFDQIDVHGPIEIVQLLGISYHTNLALIAETMDPITTQPWSAAMIPKNSSTWPIILPTHTFNSAPDLDVLIIPGGPGMRSPYLNNTLKWIRETTPKVKHVITICTGSGLAARAGIMSGRKATTNKTSWPGIIPFGPNTTWVTRARWVEDHSAEPPIWSSSGVTAGLDLMFHFVETYYGEDLAASIAKITEYVRDRDASNDPFARNETDVLPIGMP